MTSPVLSRRPRSVRKRVVRARGGDLGERKRHVVSILYRTTVGYALHNGVPVPAASSFDAAPRPISCLCMSGRGPHPPARTRATQCAEILYDPGVTQRSSYPGVVESPRARSSRSLRRDARQREAATGPEHIHRNRQRDARLASPRAVKAIFCRSLLLILFSSFCAPPPSSYLEYVISGTKGVEEGCRLLVARSSSLALLTISGASLLFSAVAPGCASHREFFRRSSLARARAHFYLCDS